MYTIDDLQTLMARLRDPDGGCPWDLGQNFHTIAPSTIEEAYEVADTIERNDLKHLPEELGDLLFQVIFYSQLGKEEGLFTLEQVVDGIVTKLLRRHPHVFPDGTLDGSRSTQEIDQNKVNANWEAIKEQERQGKGLSHMLDDVPIDLPALTRAQKLQKRVARAGWDWQQLGQLLDKLDEEIAEFKEAVTEAQSAQIPLNESPQVADELGDILFMGVNFARFLGLDAESCLRANNQKFENRIRYIERVLNESGLKFTDTDGDTIEKLWQRSKLEGNTSIK